ncbi:glutamate formimidoyltransferase [bacterium]|nr:glutamate formimidoyltransferase [bacterium]
MKQIVECVPNFSEGRDKTIIDAITSEVNKIKGVKLLDVDPGNATNRTVVTIAGDPNPTVEAAFLMIKKAYELIDMRKHKGAHARQGACDVCPFIPVSNITMKECVELSHRLAKKIADELNLPVYLYAEAAQKPERRRLPDIRVGEYEALEEKLKKPEWKPDYGPARFDPKFGVLTTGARKFLIAYNINLNTTNTQIAKEVGWNIREVGRAKRDKNGDRIKDKDGNLIRDPGLLKECQAAGWFISEFGRAQVTMNLTDFNITPVHKAFDTSKDEAEKLGAYVTGSEIVGLIPKEAMLQAGRHYLKRQGMTTGIPEPEIIRIAILSLGLNDLYNFDPKKKIIEYQVEEPGMLTSMTLTDFGNELSSNSPAPGGGSVAALIASLGCGLSSMVAALTHNKKGYTQHNELMEEIGIKTQGLKDELIKIVDTDTEAFNAVMDAMKLPKSSDEEIKQRKKAIDEANKNATLVPFSVLEKTISGLELSKKVAELGNKNSLSDAGVAGLTLRSGAFGAYYNVLINLKGIEDKSWVNDIAKKADSLAQKADALGQEIQDFVLSSLRGK